MIKKVAKKTVKKTSSGPKVTVYSTPTCPFCHKAKDFLKENKIAFKDIDVSKDHDAAQDMIEKSGQMGVPVIEIGDEIIVGFDKAKMKKALKL
ncbi:NrdH-redoxin [Candidatus Woesearchaeota archaeon CG10_big_fil_rev_8_21_14_0_10_37_12]|nr:MAG: NrdH-redoxin [Candidatus Woesearchaeota archaeon CG10_big_fil_rev_8_21_14_0_10_37_12]